MTATWYLLPVKISFCKNFPPIRPCSRPYFTLSFAVSLRSGASPIAATWSAVIRAHVAAQKCHISVICTRCRNLHDLCQQWEGKYTYPRIPRISISCPVPGWMDRNWHGVNAKVIRTSRLRTTNKQTKNNPSLRFKGTRYNIRTSSFTLCILTFIKNNLRTKLRTYRLRSVKY